MNSVFVDVDTQLDFLYPAGALYVPGAERMAPTIERLNRYAVENGIPVISTADAHTENDPEFRVWPPHCVAGTVGQQKPKSTLLPDRIAVSGEAGNFVIGTADQIIVEKQQNDVFTNPNLNAVLAHLAADRYVVYGVVTEICVRCAALGLLETGKRVELVRDAVVSLDKEKADAMFREFTAGGGVLTSADEVCR